MGFDFVRQVRVRLGLRLDVGDDLTDGSHLSSRKEKKKQKGRKREEDRRCGLAGEVMSNHSAVKSGKICDLIAFLFSYVMSIGDNSIPHKETHPVAERLFNMFDSGVLFTTIIGCTAKYCRNFRVVVKTLYASF
jgi:hypothetical protein